MRNTGESSPFPQPASSEQAAPVSPSNDPETPVISQSEQDKAFYRNSALGSIAIMGHEKTIVEDEPGVENITWKRPETEPYDPLKRFAATHRVRKLNVGGTPVDLQTGKIIPHSHKDKPYVATPRNTAQAMAANRNGRRADRITVRSNHMRDIAELHHDFTLLEGEDHNPEPRELQMPKRHNPVKEWLGDFLVGGESDFKNELENTRMTGSQKSNVKKDRRTLRRLHRANDRDARRLLRSGDNKDISGRVIAGREKAKEQSKITIQRTGTILKNGTNKVGTLTKRGVQAVVRGADKQSRRLYGVAQKTGTRAKNGAKSLVHEASSQTQKDYRATKVVIEKARKKFADRKNKKSD